MLHVSKGQVLIYLCFFNKQAIVWQFFDRTQ